ncbi:MAG: AbrB/MazE/SpoVT family DNA-binding domain-containing protein [Ruminococcaceae bacterium]|nr:AbrB/MazE/SpoVT family DNA-binding domain-containing protein [Oscillospiraceae bacterium]
MKSIGVIRKIDELGRIVLPVEFRRTLNIKKNDAVEIYAQGNSIYITKSHPACVICGKTTKLTEVDGKFICRGCAKKLGRMYADQKTIPFPEDIVDNMIENYEDIIPGGIDEDQAIAQ